MRFNDSAALSGELNYMTEVPSKLKLIHDPVSRANNVLTYSINSTALFFCMYWDNKLSLVWRVSEDS